MGIARVTFSEDCEVVVGGEPDEPDQPILNPRPVGRTNQPIIMTDGLHCFSLQTATPFAPLWQVGQVSQTRKLDLEFE